MNLRYFDTAEAGLRWMRRYYREQPQLNAKKAVASLMRAEAVLRDNPFAGSKYEDSARVRTYPLHGTVFSFLYTVAEDTVWVIDVHDQRGYRSAEALRHFTAELRQRMRR
ncbi:type II toxin-antitoxin system RelE/ParE family toxin [Marinovum sp. 2_MG-2023]|uniref:type II toxin-antitoxin system RelE/ParE family toxin n=1 Tax=unclassified Marinovum TaxID=2647166 RepID=UPI0026E43BEA|nr:MULTISPECIES: type II toxin-antitoxin system RelE/ParE family toxin [unclassified Marinovum]MDO6732999.1 type II toxin-antitoxin system RelE/ParE family toxin [Marinovum sp. 2_MG-2023]MDO6782262.1 type II toxin-antitoxin system RelE/ParE family toxin [Marinovum sp. 1_MG-2023]